VVTLSQPYRNLVGLDISGSLLYRDSEWVALSLKGRVLKLPRELVSRVSLPKARFESTDNEIRKLR